MKDVFVQQQRTRLGRKRTIWFLGEIVVRFNYVIVRVRNTENTVWQHAKITWSRI